ncbi:MAG: hypothetical protein ACYDDA_12260 [Acidiferrobacteraceae bacterium]
MSPDHSAMKLGLIRTPPDAAIAPLHKYTTTAPAPGIYCDWTGRVIAFPMLLNDQIGDCVFAAFAHTIQLWTAYTDPQAIVMDDAEVLAAYSAATGYDPADPASDRGAELGKALRWWVLAGMPTPDGGPDTLAGVAAMRPIDIGGMRRAIATFGVVVAGLALPTSAQTEKVWSSTHDAPGSWGGHCVPLVGYDANGPICVTWGALKRMTWEWWARYAEQAYVPLSRDWVQATERNPAGVDWARLEADMKALG